MAQTIWKNLFKVYFEILVLASHLLTTRGNWDVQASRLESYLLLMNYILKTETINQ